LSEFIITSLLPSQDISVTLIILGAFFFAGTIKGFLGIGLPPAAMAILTLVIDTPIAISLLTLPIIFTNLFQYLGCEKPFEIAKRYWLFGLSIMVSIFFTSLFIMSFPRSIISVTIGFAMVLFSLSQMLGAKISFGASSMWHIAIGVSAGVLGGLSSIWSPPVAMYLLARNVSKSEFIGATGFLFLAGSVPLAIGLGFAGVLTIETILHSLVGLIAVLMGFWAGEWLRGHVQQDSFRQFVLWAFLFMGARLIAIGLF
jgi:uncharacterized membrane protein YfcA